MLARGNENVRAPGENHERSQPFLRLQEIISCFSLKGHLTISYRNFKNFNRVSFRNDIAQQDWTCNGSDDLNVLWADWKTKF